MKRPLLLMAVLTACDPGGPQEPRSSEIEIQLGNPVGVEAKAALRAAVVWTYARDSEMRFVTTADIAVDPTEPTQDVVLDLPKRDVRANINPIEDLLLASGALVLDAYRPRFVVYEDVDGDAEFEPTLFEATGPDRVLGVDLGDVNIAAILDLEAVIERLGVEGAGRFFQASGGRYSAFVNVDASFNSLTVKPWKSPMLLVLDDSDFPRHSLECLRPIVSSSATSSSLTVYVDTGVDPGLCGVEADACSTLALASLEAPKIVIYESSTLIRDAQCIDQNGYESLTIAKGTIECVSCGCGPRFDTQVYIANKAALPTWWPCGKTVEYCNAAESLTDYQRFCPG